jgi:hypothetical protein
MGKGRKASKSATLTAHNFLPSLNKPNEVIGEFISIQGSDWQGCPASEKEKWFRCIVRKFDAPGVYFSFNLGGWRLRALMLELNADWCLLLHSDWGCLSEDAVQGGWSWAVRMGLQSVTRTAPSRFIHGIHEYHE